MPNPQPGQRLPHGLGVGRHGQVHGSRVGRVVSGEDLQEQSHVFGRLRQGADLVETAGEGHQPIAAHAAVGGLQPGDAAERRRAADRAASVGADGKRRHPRGHAGGRPAAGTAGNPREVPGIMRGMKGRVLVRPAHGELVHVRLADQHGVGRLQPGDDRRVVGRAEVLQDSRCAGRRLALRAEHVLDRHGQSGQAAQRLAGRRRRSISSARASAA